MTATAQLPTPLELYFDGNYVGKYGTADVLSMGGTYYLVMGDSVRPAYDHELKQMFS